MGLDVVNCTKWTKVVQNTVWSESIGRKRQMATNSASKLPAGTPTNSIGLNFGPVMGNLPAYTELFIEVYLVQ